MGEIIKKFILAIAAVMVALGLTLIIFSTFTKKEENDKEGLNVTTEAATFVPTTEATSEAVLEEDSQELDSKDAEAMLSEEASMTDASLTEGQLVEEEGQIEGQGIDPSGQDQLVENQNDNSNGTGSADAVNNQTGNTSVSNSQANTNALGANATTDYTGLFDGRTVSDTKAPVFLILNKSPSVVKGTVFNVNDFIGYGDDVDRSPEVVISGEVNTDELGSYPVTVTITDHSGHSNSASLDVNVVEGSSGGDSSGGSPNIDYEEFASFAGNYKNDNTSLGIDVSRWQNDIDFDKVKAAGVDFVIMRIGGYDEGSHYTDRCYYANMSGAKAAGLKVGIYWHAEESTEAEVKASVQYMMDVLDGQKLDFPIAYDWEDFAHFQSYEMSMYDLNDCYTVFAGECSKYGYNCCLYSSMNFLNNTWSLSGSALGTDIPVWLAHYTSSTSYSGEYFMWQHSSKGSVDGIGGAVDLNVLYLDKFNPYTNVQ
ncbi:MAG: hypothetical protein K6E10_03665 [Eubacterium sp.]|nr:hypothetical protein [Eubacterium sp.]